MTLGRTEREVSEYTEREMRGIAALSPSNHWHPKTHNNPSTQPAKNLKPNPLRLINNNPSTKRLNPMPSFTIKASQTHNPTTPPLVVVGSTNADIYVEIDRLPREGETISAKTGQTLPGGKGANQAVCGGKLSYPTFFVGQIGEDAHGKLISDRLRNVSGAPTGHAVVMLQSDGQNPIIIVGGANMSCWPDAMCDDDLEVVRNAGIVLLQREIPDFVNIQVAKVNEASLFEDLNESWEVLAEPIQTVMRRYGIPEPYEKLKELTRGRAVTRENIREFIEGLELPTEAKANLLELTPRTYVGAAVELARAVDMAVNSVNRLRYWTDTENNCK